MGSATSTTDRMPGRGRPGGFTLAESLIASVVLAVATVAIVLPFSAACRQAEVGDEKVQASALARQLLEEIGSRPFEDPTDGSRTLGPEQNEQGRSGFDNIDDYHGYSDSTDDLRSLDGTRLDWSAGYYRRNVSVEYRASPAGPATGTGDFALVSITVTGPDGQSLAVQRLMARYPRGNGR